MKSGLSALLGLVVLGAAASASAATYTYTFVKPGDINEICYDGNYQNLGGDSSIRLGNVAQVVLFKVTLPGDLAGKTITSATLTAGTTNVTGNLGSIKAVEMKPTGPAWTVGGGLWADRYGANDTGADKWFAVRNADGSGTGWDGTVYTTANAYTVTGSGMDTATDFGTTLDTQTILSTTTTATWSVTAAVQDWANGANNRGLALSFPTPSATYPALANLTSPTLTITYAAVPEPATIGVLAIGSLTLLRRRRHTA